MSIMFGWMFLVYIYFMDKVLIINKIYLHISFILRNLEYSNRRDYA